MDAPSQRRLAAIVCADMVGYSRLMGIDEVGTLASLHAHRAELIEPKIAERGGRVVKTMGDGLLLEFPSVVDATTCAIEVQKEMVARNDGVDPDQRITFRFGVHVGDIIIDADDILGDGVNIAARVEGLAEPGGVAISNRVYDDVRDRLGTAFTDMGDQTLKNIARPIRVWRWSPVETGPKADLSIDVTSARANKPSIVVLPFTNMSDDKEQEFFSDGITEDLIMALSRIRQLFVMARNTAFTFKGQAVDVRAVAKDLNVRYVLEGSVRRAGDRLRIAAQLIDGASGDHLWAERYDKDLTDIFEIQDEITRIVAGTIEPEITKAEFERQRHVPPESLDAWQLYQRGVFHFHRLTPEDDVAARKYLEAAIARDVGFSPSHAMLARCVSRNANSELDPDVDKIYAIALDAARRAVSLDGDDAHAHTALGFASRPSDLVTSLRAFEDALSLNPNLASAHFGLGTALLDAGRTDEALVHAETAMLLSPRDPLMPLYRAMLGTIRFALGDDEGALALLPGLSQGKVPGTRRAALRVAALAFLGREDQMDAEREALLAIHPHLTIALAARYNRDVGERLTQGLRKAGLPE